MTGLAPGPIGGIERWLVTLFPTNPLYGESQEHIIGNVGQ